MAEHPVEPDEVGKATRPVVVDLYDGAYGPTVRIDVQDGSALERIRALFLVLARRERSEVVLEESPEYEFSGLHRMRLRMGDEGHHRGKDLERVAAGGLVELVWTLSAAGWVSKAEMVEPLLRDGTPGHQYLTAEGVDDALVELAYLEGPRAG